MMPREKVILHNPHSAISFSVPKASNSCSKLSVLGREKKVPAILEAFNLFNWFNASGYPREKFDRAGNALLSFGQSNGAYEPRQVQISFRVSYR